MPWKKGESGNLRGRPPKGRTLAELLAAAGAKKNPGGVELQQAAAAKLWAMIDSGQIVIDGETIPLDPTQWLRAVAFVFGHVDGPARALPTETSSPAGDLLDQVLSDLRDEDHADQTAVAAGLGALVLATLASGDREALNFAGVLQQALGREQPDVAQLVGIRRYFLALPEPIHASAAAFFQLPAVLAILQRGIAHE